jgi:ferritin
MRKGLVDLESEIQNLRKIQKELLFETGLDPSNPEEAIWKSPETRKEVEKQIDDLTTLMCTEMDHIQSALLKTVVLLSEKLAKDPPPPPDDQTHAG